MILEIVSAETKLFSGDVNSIYLPGVEGDFQILNNHAPIVSILKNGTIRMSSSNFKFNKSNEVYFKKINDQNYTISIQSGTIEMKNNKAIILID